ncbi:hypothetical protein RN001_013575 [Aquatica leii]|uniref:Transmembrane protein n=1 Tax=Aquatica leii TaxID=1421715 RepID=A0AAN7SNS7_9COLE|nr:hypothetical protein RN001_013575 [Aquatica leii]
MADEIKCERNCGVDKSHEEKCPLKKPSWFSTLSMKSICCEHDPNIIRLILCYFCVLVYYYDQYLNYVSADVFGFRKKRERCFWKGIPFWTN